jgi:hypothetical protein
MQLLRTIQLSAVVLATLAQAQNPFTFTTAPVVSVGVPFNITWAPSTGTVQTVSLILRQGDATALNDVLNIASEFSQSNVLENRETKANITQTAAITNVGYYVWTPPASLQKASNYAFEIRNDQNQFLVNYSEQFSIDSTNSSPNSFISTGVVSATTSSGGAAVTNAASATGSAVVVTTTNSKGVATTISTTVMSTGSASATTSSAQTQSTNAASGKDRLVSGGLVLGLVGAVMAAL